MSFNDRLVAGDQSRAPKPGVELRADSGLTYKIEDVLKENPRPIDICLSRNVSYPCYAIIVYDESR